MKNNIDNDERTSLPEDNGTSELNQLPQAGVTAYNPLHVGRMGNRHERNTSQTFNASDINGGFIPAESYEKWERVPSYKQPTIGDSKEDAPEPSKNNGAFE